MVLDGTKFVDCNKATLDMFRCASKEEFISKHPAELSSPQQPCGKDSFAAANAHIKEAFRVGSTFFEWTHKRFDGRVFPAEVLLSKFEIGDRVFLQAVVRDVTKRNQTEENLKKAKSEIEAAKLELEKTNRQLEKLSTTDGLTGVANRRRFDQALVTEWRRALRYQKPLTLIMSDIDFFKNYNDHYGHVKGDECLKRVASILDSVARRPGDLVARYGGEEFVIILTDTASEGALKLAERIRKDIVSLKIPHDSSPISDYVTLSLGVASVTPKDGLSPQRLIEEADKVLYKVKHEGRNRVIALTLELLK
jgi:diguanylate cyclase (GGDEF)-like protein/PAS domain S-box-containing protein